MLSWRRRQKEADGEGGRQKGDTSMPSVPEGGGPSYSRVGTAAEIVGEEAKASSSKLEIRLPLGDVAHKDSRDLRSLEVLNREAEEELERLLKEQDALREAARRLAADSELSTSEHADLAWQHLAEGLTRLWASITGLAVDVARRLSPKGSPRPGSPSSLRLVLPGTPPPRTPGRTPASRRAAGAGSPDKAMLASGEADVREAHLSRVLSRSKSLKRAGTWNSTGREVAAATGDGGEEEAMRMAAARVLDDKAEKACRAAYVWCPSHVSRQVWDLSMLVLIVYSCVIVPFRIGMGSNATGALATFDVVVTCTFILDLCLNFNTAYAEGHYVIIDRCMIAQNYVRGWFWIDLASSFPFEAFDTWLDTVLHPSTAHLDDGETAHSSSFKLLRALRLFRLVRLLKLLKLQSYIDTIEDRSGLSLQVLQIIKMILGLCYLTHLLGCGWFYIADNAHVDQSTWLSSYDGGSGLDASVDIQYLYSIYWALMTLTTVGYGDITPANNGERFYALCSLLIGALVFGYMLSSIGDLIASLDKNGAKLQERLDEVKEFTRWHSMAPDLAARVRRYYEEFYARARPSGTDGEILETLAPALSRDVMNHLLAQTVCKVPFFFVPSLGSRADAPDAPPDVDFQLAVYPLLKPVVREARETVVAKGSVGDSLVFLLKGQVDAFGEFDPGPGQGGDPSGHQLYSVTERGEFLTEHVLSDEPCPVSYRAAFTRSEFYFLSLADLLDLIDKFPHARAELARFAFDDLMSHKKQRTWSLRFARNRPIRSEGLLNAEQLSEMRRQRAALKLQVGWLRRALVLLEQRLDVEGGYEKLLPTLYGATPKSEIRKRELAKERRLKARAINNIMDAEVDKLGMLPFGGRFSPRIRTGGGAPPTAAPPAAPAPSSSRSGRREKAGSPSNAAAAPTASSRKSPPSARGRASKASPTPKASAGLGRVEQMIQQQTSQSGDGGGGGAAAVSLSPLEVRMAEREQQLGKLGAMISLLAEQRSKAAAAISEGADPQALKA